MYSKTHGVQTASATHWCEVKTPPFLAFAPPFAAAPLLPAAPEEEVEAAEENAAAALEEEDEEGESFGVEGAAGGEEEPEVDVVEVSKLVVLCWTASSELTTSSSPGRTSLTRSKPRGPKAQSSEATHQSELPSAFARALCCAFLKEEKKK